MATTTQATPLKLPQAPQGYDQRDQDHTRRLVELTFNQIARSVQMASGGDTKIGAFQQITITPLANTTALTISNVTHTLASTLVNWTATWNNTGVTFNGFIFNVTNTASAVGSKLVSFQLSGTPFLEVQTTGAGASGQVIVSGSTFDVQRAGTGISFFSVTTAGSGIVFVKTTVLRNTTTSFQLQNSGGGALLRWDDTLNAPFALILAGDLQCGKITAAGRLILQNVSDSDLTTDIKIDADDVWSGTTNTRTFCRFTITDTLSGASSLIANWLVGGVTMFQVTKGGKATALTIEGAPTATLSALILTGPTYTTNVVLATMTATWNGGAVVFTAIKLNITNTASAAGSLLMDLQVGAASQWSVDKGGVVVQAGALTISAGGATITGQVVLQTDVGLRFNNHTNGAAAQTGTLTNGPVAGNPNFWLPVSIAGTTRYIPCW